MTRLYGSLIASQDVPRTLYRLAVDLDLRSVRLVLGSCGRRRFPERVREGGRGLSAKTPCLFARAHWITSVIDGPN